MARRPMTRVLLHYGAGPRWRDELVAVADQNLQVDICDEADDELFYSLLPDAEVLWHALRPISASDIEKARSLRLIQKIGIGVNTIDIDAASRQGIAVCNMPGTNSQAVAEMALLLMLACLRRLPVLDRATRAARGWALDKDLLDRFGEIGGRRVGLVGYGAVARALTPALQGLGAKVSYTASAPKAEVNLEFVSLHDLLQRSDI